MINKPHLNIKLLLPGKLKLSAPRWPVGGWGWSTALILIGIMAWFLTDWVIINKECLFDPAIQNDDVYQHVFYVHQYKGLLIDDPMANEMAGLGTPFHHFVYKLVTPVFDVPSATKVVQGIALSIILLAGVIVIYTRGLAVGCLMLFLTLRTSEILVMVFGGSPRGFSFPLLLLWLAGVLAPSRWVRIVAAALAALAYPPAVILILGFEGIYALRNGVPFRKRYFQRRAVRYILLVAMVGGLLSVYFALKGDAGRMPTWQEVKVRTEFHKFGRSKMYPITAESKNIMTGVLSAFKVQKRPLIKWSMLKERSEIRDIIPLIPFLLFIILIWQKRASVDPVVIAIFLATSVLTTVALLGAFRFYIPSRYMYYGTSLLAVAFPVYVIRTMQDKFRKQPSPTGNSTGLGRLKNVPYSAMINVIVSAGIILTWAILGTVGKNRAMSINSKDDKPLYEYVKSLPPDAKFFGHPYDCDGIPFWTGRGVVSNVETTMPWGEKMWNIQSKRLAESLYALYTQDRATFLKFCNFYGVSHLLIRKGRYFGDIENKSVTFRPFINFTLKLLKDVKPEKLAINKVSRKSLVYIDDRWAVIDVNQLREDWSGASAESALKEMP